MRNMKVAAGQFTVTEKPEHNISIISGFTSEAARNHARILLLPEGLIARSDDDPRYTADHAQTIDGPFVTALRGISEANNLAIMGTVHLHEDTADLPYNCFLVIDHGRILLEYRKIHLYNAFGERESDSIAPGHEIPPLVDIDGWMFGVMTCYDIRFPELARRHAVAGADVLVVSAAWARGDGKGIIGRPYARRVRWRTPAVLWRAASIAGMTSAIVWWLIRPREFLRSPANATN